MKELGPVEGGRKLTPMVQKGICQEWATSFRGKGRGKKIPWRIRKKKIEFLLYHGGRREKTMN